MLLAVDVHYQDATAYIAGVTFNNWQDAQPDQIYYDRLHGVAGYEPGNFYQREMPCIVHLLKVYGLVPTTIVIDGYVYLGDKLSPGLGWHLFNQLQGKVPVIGVAKKFFTNTSHNSVILRGNSLKPLFITSAGLAVAQAKQNILAMNGKYRLPTLLKTADRESHRCINIPQLADG